MNGLLRGYAAALNGLGYSLDDFQVPLVPLPQDKFVPLSKEVLAKRLEERLSKLNRFRSFETIVFTELPLIHQKRLDEIKYLKKQMVLRELSSELSSAEKIFSAISQTAMDPKIKELVARRIQDLKEKIV